MRARDRGLIVANLDVEQALAASLPGDQRPRGGPATLPRSVYRTLAGFATLLRAVARPGDALWLPHPVPPSTLCEVPGMPCPELLSEPLKSPSLRALTHGPRPVVDLLAWGESRPTAELRQRLVRADDDETPQRPPSNPPQWVEGTLTADHLDALWSLPSPSPETVARVHHRRFVFDLNRTLGTLLPGSRWLNGLDALHDHLRRLDPPAVDAWVVKSPLSAAGRDRLWGHGRTLDGKLSRGLEKLFARWPGLLFEPWVERLDDFGVSAWVDDQRVTSWGLHRQLVDRRGGFLGIELTHRPDGRAPWAEAMAQPWGETVRAVGNALHRQGYRGPFGIDGFSYRDAAGRRRWHLLGEINARLTFGAMARWLRVRVAPHDPTVRLRLAARLRQPLRPDDHRRPLLRPTSTSTAAAWLESGPN